MTLPYKIGTKSLIARFVEIDEVIHVFKQRPIVQVCGNSESVSKVVEGASDTTPDNSVQYTPVDAGALVAGITPSL